MIRTASPSDWYVTPCVSCDHEYQHKTIKPIQCLNCKRILRYDCGLLARQLSNIVLCLIESKAHDRLLGITVARLYASEDKPDVLINLDELIDDLARIKLVVRNGYWRYDKKLTHGYPTARELITGGNKVL